MIYDSNIDLNTYVACVNISQCNGTDIKIRA